MKDTANPIGEIHEIEAVDLYVDHLIQEWEDNKEDVPWWKFWYNISLDKVTTFLMEALDDLIAYVDGMVETGADKKATVLAAIERIYDFVIKEALPIWLMPFAGSIKAYIIYTLISNAIDWMVEKYRNGSWKMKEDNKVEALWSATQAAGRITGN